MLCRGTTVSGWTCRATAESIRLAPSRAVGIVVPRPSGLRAEIDETKNRLLRCRTTVTYAGKWLSSGEDMARVALKHLSTP